VCSSSSSPYLSFLPLPLLPTRLHLTHLLPSDWLIGNITKSVIPTATLTNTSTFTGTTSFGGYTYSSSISYVSGLLANSSVGVNHADTVGVNGANPVDGLVAVVEVKITGRPAGESANSAS
jgi:hypothetical protein